MTGDIKLGAYSLYGTIVYAMNYYTIDVEGFVILFILLVADTILGIAKSYVLHRKDSNWFSSQKLKIGVISKVSIIFFVILFALVANQWLDDALFAQIAVSSVLGLMIVAEFISILQNTIMIRTKQEIAEFDALTMVLNYVLKLLQKFITEKIDHTDK